MTDPKDPLPPAQPNAPAQREPQDRLDEMATILAGRLVAAITIEKWGRIEVQREIHAALVRVVAEEQAKCLEALVELREKAKGFADADYAHAAQGGGIYFTADHIRGSAAAYVDMVKHIEQAIRARGLKEKP